MFVVTVTSEAFNLPQALRLAPQAMETPAHHKVNSHRAETELSKSFPGSVLEKHYRYLKGLLDWYVHFGLPFPPLQGDGNTVILRGRSNMRKQNVFERLWKDLFGKIFQVSCPFQRQKSAPLCIQPFLLSYVNWLLNSCKNSNEALVEFCCT